MMASIQDVSTCYSTKDTSAGRRLQAASSHASVASKQASLRCTDHRWEYVSGDGRAMIWMTPATFDKYVAAWLEVRGITQVTGPKYVEAFQVCRRVSYWQYCRDPEVHILTQPVAIRRQVSGATTENH